MNRNFDMQNNQDAQVTNLEQFNTIDDAYNERNWEAYSSLLYENFCGWTPGDAKQQREAEHVRVAKEFCETSADNRVHNSSRYVMTARSIQKLLKTLRSAIKKKAHNHRSISHI
jgi:hypothetical protein